MSPDALTCRCARGATWPHQYAPAPAGRCPSSGPNPARMVAEEAHTAAVVAAVQAEDDSARVAALQSAARDALEAIDEAMPHVGAFWARDLLGAAAHELGVALSLEHGDA